MGLALFRGNWYGAMGHGFLQGKMTFNLPQSTESSYGHAYKFAAYFLIQLILKKFS